MDAENTPPASGAGLAAFSGVGRPRYYCLVCAISISNTSVNTVRSVTLSNYATCTRTLRPVALDVCRQHVARGKPLNCYVHTGVCYGALKKELEAQRDAKDAAVTQGKGARR